MLERERLVRGEQAAPGLAGTRRNARRCPEYESFNFAKEAYLMVNFNLMPSDAHPSGDALRLIRFGLSIQGCPGATSDP